MRHATPIALAVALLAGPAVADESQIEGVPPLPERIERALRDMMGDVQPKLDEALEYLRSLGAMDDPLNYQMPEVLPNGDIIIRRRQDAPALDPDAPAGPDGPAAPDAPPARRQDLFFDPEGGIRT